MYKNQWQEAFKGTKYANYLQASAILCFLHPSSLLGGSLLLAHRPGGQFSSQR